ncbi:hypothetical protein [Streptomyces sp. NPDC055105]|uniref:hypothetical protein n=1 Tax=Streptomyces sp. NPDC055105 TaxID=3365719 RepID=UPI0037D8B25B
MSGGQSGLPRLLAAAETAAPVDAVDVIAEDLRPRNTSDSYAADWKQWTEYCALLELPVTAITPAA